MRQGFVSHNPVVLTSDQEDALMNRKVWNSGYKLWKLKSSQPHLFANIDRLKDGARATPGADSSSDAGSIPGFERCAAGWLYQKQHQLFLEEATNRCLYFDADTNTYRDFNVGEDLSAELTLTGVATTSSTSNAAGSRQASAASAPSLSGQQSARHLVIMDLHKAADIFKLDFTHMDRPAAMLAVYKHIDGAVAPEAAAKGLHEKLLKRFAGHRTKWSDDALQAALMESMMAIATEQKASAGVAGVVALIFGSRLVVATSHGAACAIADALPGDMKDVRMASASAAGECAELQVACINLDCRSASCILLHTEAIDEQAARAAAAHAERCRPRAGAIALLQGMPASTRSRAAACAHLGWASEEPEEQVAKRARAEKDRAKQVRCRRVLIKYTGCRKASDPVRRKPVRRSLAEAEASMLQVLSALEEARARGGTAAAEAAFTQQCRAISECTSSLKGGDLAGDIGWLKLPEIKPGEKIPKELALRMQTIRTALSLAVNEVSDIVVSDDGVHLLKRAA